MKTLAHTCLLAAALAVGGAAHAQGRGHGGGHAKGHDKHAERAAGRRDVRYDRAYGDARDYRPPRGRRVPPGLAKKGGLPPGRARRLRAADGAFALRDVFARNGYTVVRTAPAGASQYVSYRDAGGALRRAVVSPGEDRLAFGNVPSSILSEVLARLY